METETNTEELSPEEAKASLGLSTRLSEQFLMSQVPQEEETLEQETTNEEPAPEQEMTPTAETPDPNALKEEMMASLKKDIAEIVKGEMSTLKEELTNALEEED